MTTAIIGYTGFVGSNLIKQFQFDEFYNSKNIEKIVGKDFELLVCSGAPAVKWIANKEPTKDRQNLQRLINCLKTVTAQKVILISTVDVYRVPIGVTEDSKTNIEDLHPYGLHRLELERFIQQQFDGLVLRLPGLFGNGLKKNIIYDFLNNNCLDRIHKDSIFQFYNLAYLWKDIKIAFEHNLSLMNLATEPVSVEEVAAKAFGLKFVNETPQPPAKYNMLTKHFKVFDGYEPGYISSKEEVLLDLKKFVDSQKL